MKRWSKLFPFQVALAAFTLGQCHAQPFLQPNLTNLATIASNPALVGTEDNLSFFVQHRTDAFLKHSLAQGSLYMPKLKMGGGILIDSYQSLLENHTRASLNFSYRIKTSRGFWQFGLAPVVHSFQLHTQHLTIRHSEDVFTPTSVTQVGINWNAGIMYKGKRILSSFGIQQIMKQANSLNPYFQHPVLSALLHYDLFSAGDFTYTPMLYGHYADGFEEVGVLGNQVKYKPLLFAFQYGTNHSWSSTLAVHYKSEPLPFHVKLGYSFSERRLGIGKAWVHEVFLQFDFKRTSKKRPENSFKDLPELPSPLFF